MNFTKEWHNCNLKIQAADDQYITVNGVIKVNKTIPRPSHLPHGKIPMFIMVFLNTHYMAGNGRLLRGFCPGCDIALIQEQFLAYAGNVLMLYIAYNISNA